MWIINQSQNLINIIPILILLVFISEAANKLFRVDFEETIPFTIAGIVLVLYFFGVIGHLLLGLYLIFSLVGISALYLLALVIKDRKFHISNYSGLIVLFVWIFLSNYLYRTQFLVHHDDFNHWGLELKNLFALNKIPFSPIANTAYQDYPPGASLFQYLVVKLYGEFSEGVALQAMWIWVYSCLLYPIKAIRVYSFGIKRGVFLCLYGVFGFLLPVVVQVDPNSIIDFHSYLMVDYLLACIFGLAMILSTSLSANKNQFFNVLFLMILLAVMPSIKLVGSLLSIFILVIAIYNTRLFKGKNLIILLDIFVLSLSVLLSILLWKYFIYSHNIIPSNVNGGSFAVLNNFLHLNFEFPSRAKDIAILYFTGFYKLFPIRGVVQGSILHLYIFLNLISMALYLNFCNAPIGLKIKYNILIINIIFIIYFLITSFMYIFVLSDGESYGLSSYLRYLSYFSLGCFYLVVAQLLRLGMPLNKGLLTIFSGLILLSPIAMVNSVTLDAFSSSLKVYLSNSDTMSITPVSDPVNDNILKINKYINNNINEISTNSLVCFFEGDEGSSYGYSMMSRYHLAPLHTKRILSYKTINAEHEAYLLSQFKEHSKDCSLIFIISKNENVDKYFQRFFVGPLEDFGVYSRKDEINGPFLFNGNAVGK